MRYLVILFGVMALVLMPLAALAQEHKAADQAGPQEAAVAQTPGAEQAESPATVSGLPHEDRALVAASLSCSIAFIVAVSILGAAYAVAHVGSAAIGAASEKPEMMGRSLVFVALGEGLAILGIVVAILLYTILKTMV
ncbi:MAG: hypothetical protein GWP05_08040 [Anaerolineaceae bacterium]|nr:hypothetical protein [Anaerolineaceae bacterium]